MTHGLQRRAPAPCATALLAFASAVLALSCSDPSAPRGEPGLRIVSAPESDTVFSTPDTPLIVELFGEDGVALPNVDVVIDVQPAIPGARPPRIEFDPYGGPRILRTDGAGRAGDSLWVGAVAGEGWIIAAVPALDLRDSVPITILPGAPVVLRLAPDDTAVLVGGSYTLRARMNDTHGNARDDDVEYEVLSGPATVDGAVLTGTAPGRVQVRALSGAFGDTVQMSVVPLGWLTLHGAGNSIALVRTDGAEAREVLPQSVYRRPESPAWAPNGDTLVFIDRERLAFVTRDGRSRDIDTGGRPVFSAGVSMSVDGWIYFTVGEHEIATTVWRVRADGSGLQQVSEVLPWGAESMSWPNPTGDHVVYRTNRVDAFLVRTVSPTLGVIDTLHGGGHSPRWSPDGTRIAYRTSTNLLWIMDADGSNRRLVGGGITLNPGFSWSPDGEWIAGVSVPGLVLVQVETGLVLPLPFGQAWGATNPAWWPTGGTPDP